MSLDKVLKTVYVVGDFGNKNRDGDFRPFTGKSKSKTSGDPQPLDYSEFVKYFGAGTPELGVLDEGNPFYRILRPWSPPGSPVAAGASEMAAVVVGAIPGIVREAAKALADFELAVQPLGTLTAYKHGEIDEVETPKAYAELLDACCRDNAALGQIFTKLGLSAKLEQWSRDNNELLARLRATDRTFSEFAKRPNNTNNLFQVLLKKRIQDVVDEAVQKLQDSFNAKAQASGFVANGAGPILDVTTVGNELEKAAFVTALVTKDARRFEKHSFDCTDPDGLFALWEAFVTDESECNWDSGAVVPSAEVEAEWKKFINRKKNQWKTKYNEEMPDLRELELRVFFYAFAGSKSLSEERVAELAYFAMNGIGLASRDDAQAAIAVAKSLGIDANRSKKPSSGKDLEVDVENNGGEPDKFANSTEASWHGEDKKNIRKHANLIRVLTFYMSVVTDHAKRKLIASLLLTARGYTSNLMKHLKSRGYIQLIDSLVGEASEAYRKLLETKEKMVSAGARAADGKVSTSETKVTQLSPQVQQETPVPVTITVQGEERSATDPPATDPPATDPPATDPPATDTPATDTPATDTPVADTPVADTPVADPTVTDPPTTDTPQAPQFQQLKDAFRSLGHPVDAGISTVAPNPPASQPNAVQECDGQLVANRFKLDELYVSLHKAMSQLAKNERPSAASAAGQLEKSGMQYLTIMFMQRQGIDFGDEEAASLGWIFELSRYGSDEEVLRNVPLNQLLTMGSNERLKKEWEEVESEFKKMLGSANERLSKLYGIEILLKSAPHGSVIYFYNGVAVNAVRKLEAPPEYFDSANIGNADTQGVPAVIYFADQQQAALDALSASKLVSRICPVVMDSGPDFSNSTLWRALTISENCLPFVSLAGPGIRLRGATRIHGNLTTQNNGLPTSPLIPAGALLLAAFLDGSFRDDNQAELVLKDANNQPVKSGYFPEQAIVPLTGVPKGLRFFLQRGNEKDEGDLIARTKHLLATLSFGVDVSIWLARLAKEKQIAPCFATSGAGEVTVTFDDKTFPACLLSSVVKVSQVGPRGAAPRAWQITINGASANTRSDYLKLLHPDSV